MSALPRRRRRRFRWRQSGWRWGQQRRRVGRKYGTGGNHLFSKTYGLTGTHRAHAVATDDVGNVYIGGSSRYNSTIGFGGPILGWGAFVAKLTPSLVHTWSQGYQGATATSDDGEVWGVAVTPDGGVVAGGMFEGTLVVGAAEHDSAGGRDAFLFRLEADGAPVWSAKYGDNSEQELRGVAFGSGAIAVGGFFQGSLNLGAATLPQNGGSDGFAARLEP